MLLFGPGKYLNYNNFSFLLPRPSSSGQILELVTHLVLTISGFTKPSSLYSRSCTEYLRHAAQLASNIFLDPPEPFSHYHNSLRRNRTDHTQQKLVSRAGKLLEQQELIRSRGEGPHHYRRWCRWICCSNQGWSGGSEGASLHCQQLTSISCSPLSGGVYRKARRSRRHMSQCRLHTLKVTTQQLSPIPYYPA